MQRSFSLCIISSRDWAIEGTYLRSITRPPWFFSIFILNLMAYVLELLKIKENYTVLIFSRILNRARVDNIGE